LGRIRGKWIKNVSKKLVERYPDKFSDDFNNNKKILTELKIIDEKLIRNKVAGYIISVVEKKKIKP
jgi:small subunit ribosomal protein S17e